MTKILNIDKESRDRLYFDLYEYSFNFKMTEMSALRELDHDSIDHVLDSRGQFRSPNFGGSWRSQPRSPVAPESRKNCHEMCDFLLSQKDYKIVVTMDWGYFYSNDLVRIREMEKFGYVTPLNIKQAVLDRPRGTLLIRNSQHEYRSYFKPGRISDQEKLSLESFLNNQENIRMGPGLRDFFKRTNKYHYINDNFFIDHDGMGMLTMLGLVRAQCIRKTVKLIRDK